MINLIKRYIVDYKINYIVPIPHLVSVIGLATFVAQNILGSNEISQVTLCAGAENPDPELTSSIIRLIIIVLGAVVVKRSIINSNRDIDTPQIPPNGHDLPSLSSSKSSYDSDSSLSDGVDPETVMTFTEVAIAFGGIATTGVILAGGTYVVFATAGFSMMVWARVMAGFTGFVSRTL